MAFEPHLHWAFHDEHVLFPAITLHSFWGFILASLIVIFICMIERYTTFILDTKSSPKAFKHSHIRLAVWRTVLYSVATTCRLFYMLVVMTFHAGLFLVVVSTLSAAQFFIELSKVRKPNTRHSPSYSTSDSRRTQSMDSLKPRRYKGKPEEIFIHPSESNLARADAVALELGLGGDTDRVKGHSYSRDSPAWEVGKGRDQARQLLLGSKKSSSEDPFSVSNDSDSESDL